MGCSNPHPHCQVTDRQTDRQTARQPDSQTERQNDRQRGRQVDRQTDRQTQLAQISHGITKGQKSQAKITLELTTKKTQIKLAQQNDSQKKRISSMICKYFIDNG